MSIVERIKKAAQKVVQVGDSDENSDWIKLVHGGREQARELQVYEEQQAEYAKRKKTT